jgi:hypothetical protein
LGIAVSCILSIWQCHRIRWLLINLTIFSHLIMSSNSSFRRRMSTTCTPKVTLVWNGQYKKHANKWLGLSTGDNCTTRHPSRLFDSIDSPPPTVHLTHTTALQLPSWSQSVNVALLRQGVCRILPPIGQISLKCLF